MKSIFSVAQAVLPIGYCGYLVYYFLGVSGSVEDAWHTGLGPTVLGLGVVALLFTIPLIFKIMRIIGGPRWPRAAPRPNAPPGHDDDDDDEAERTARAAVADAAIARYLASKAAEAASTPAPARTAKQSNSPATRAGFGRRTGS
jgi:hypothetical protein